MLLKKFILKDPRTGKLEEVFDYPECLASPTLRSRDCQLVTREPLRIPILVVPHDYLVEMDGQGETTESIYASFELRDYRDEVATQQVKQQKYDSKLSKVQDIFSISTMHKRSCITMFFTGPKPVYKQSFTDNWVWKDEGILVLTNRGHYRTIESLSLKGINDVFITGTFECGDEVMPNTQCKIIVANATASRPSTG